MQSPRDPAQPTSFHMSPEEFRQHGHALVDWIADYHQRVSGLPVQSRAQPNALRTALPPHAPTQGEPFEAIMADLEQLLLPGLTHWQSPNFFGYFPSNASFPSILGELLSAGLGIQGMLWSTSPACTELETHVLDWLVELLELPEGFRSSGRGGGVLQDSASSAALCAILSARERATGWVSNRKGCDGRLVAYVSSQTHSSVEKGVKVAGLGAEQLRVIPVDASNAMRVEALQAQVRADRAAGLVPCFVAATLGTTSAMGFDPLRAIGEVCRQEGLWMHVDGAMAGTAGLCPELRGFQAGLELADSYCFNPHKWMLTNFDCSCYFVADRSVLIKTLSILPEYLRNQATESGAVIDYRDWHVPLGRRFRALKLWMVLRHYGVEGLQALIREHVRLARLVAQWVAEDPSLELAAPVPLNLVCFRHKAGDVMNRALLERLNASGTLFMTHTVLEGRYTLRMCIGQQYTTQAHVSAAWDAIQAMIRCLEAEGL